MSNLQYFVLICDKKKKNTFIELMGSHGAACIDVSYGKGSANAGILEKALGFETEEHKVVISALIHTTKATELIDVLTAKHNFNRQNTGFAFTIPVESLSL